MTASPDRRPLCLRCDNLRDGRCALRAPASEKLDRGEAVLSCGSFIERGTGRRDLFEGSDASRR